MRLHEIEQLGDHGRDPPEVTGPERATQDVGHARHLDEGRLVFSPGIDLGHRRQKQRVDRRRHEQGAVVLDRARIGRVVLLRTELQGIHEDAHHHAVGARPGEVHEGEVPAVQVAHRRHEGDDLARFRPAPDLGT